MHFQNPSNSLFDEIIENESSIIFLFCFRAGGNYGKTDYYAEILIIKRIKIALK